MNKADLKIYLEDKVLAVFSTIDLDGKPYAAIMFFIVDKDLNFYFLSKEQTKKVLFSEKNPYVAITVLDPKESTTVQAQGKVEHITDPKDLEDLIEKLGEKNATSGKEFWPPPISKLSDGEMVVLKVTPSWLRFCDYRGETSRSDGVFHQIIP